MVHYEGSYLVMSEAELNSFLERNRHPDVVQKRQAFFAELDRMPITENPDGSVDIEFTPKRKSTVENMRSAKQGYIAEDFQLKSSFLSDWSIEPAEYDVSETILWAA